MIKVQIFALKYLIVLFQSRLISELHQRLIINISYHMAKVTLGYWKIRGLAQHLRHLLSYTGTEFDEIQYDNPEKWFKQDKTNLGLDFPNLPYLIDGDFKITESSAIAKYIINRSGKTQLLGKSSQDQGKIDNLIGTFNDIMKEIRNLFWDKDHENIKIEALEKARPKLNHLRDFVGDNQFALGYLTFIDFLIAQSLAYFEALYPSQHKNFAFWWRIKSNVEQLPGVKSYYKRPDAIHGPYLPPYAVLPVSPKKVKLAYWGVRGRAQPIRILLAYLGVQFQDHIYSGADSGKWFKDDKLKLGLDFPNLPYLIDGEYNITESSAIQRYIIQKWGKAELLGKDIQDNAQLQSIFAIFTEISGEIKGLFWNKNYETAKGGIIQKFKPKLEQLNKFIGEKPFTFGYLTLVDFIIAQDSNYIERMFPEEFKTYPFLNRIRQNFNQLPQVKAYYSSENAFKGRFYPPTAVLSVEKE